MKDINVILSTSEFALIQSALSFVARHDKENLQKFAGGTFECLLSSELNDIEMLQQKLLDSYFD